MSKYRPRIGITMGDPTGIGPEIIIGALNDKSLQSAYDIVLIGRAAIFNRAITLLKSDLRLKIIDSISSRFCSEDSIDANCVCVVETADQSVDEAIEPKVDPRGGAAAHDALVIAARATLRGELDAIVTAPLHKVALNQAGHDWPGHTELLASLCGVDQSAMMLYLPPTNDRRTGPAGFGVVHATLHMSMRQALDRLSTDLIFETIKMAQQTFTRLRQSLNLPPSPALAVAALNPHAGEGGLFGNEESTIIRPAVEQAIKLGWNVEGPLSVDTLMPIAVAGKYDSVIAMYHDQGHIALKLIDMFDAVNITLGIPIIRTSVAHGVAHDIAWKGIAKSSGMVQAILAASRLVYQSHDHAASKERLHSTGARDGI